MWQTLALIFLAQVLYVTMVTVRWMILIRGYRYVAAALSFFEILIYVYTLGIVVTQLNDASKVLVYALGFAAGALIGSWLEQWLAMGMATVQVITPRDSALAAVLREHGFGVTTWDARGRDAERAVMLISLRRRRLRELLQLVDEVEPTAVVLDLEPRSVRRGFLARRVV